MISQTLLDAQRAYIKGLEDLNAKNDEIIKTQENILKIRDKQLALRNEQVDMLKSEIIRLKTGAMV